MHGQFCGPWAVQTWVSKGKTNPAAVSSVALTSSSSSETALWWEAGCLLDVRNQKVFPGHHSVHCISGGNTRQVRVFNHRKLRVQMFIWRERTSMEKPGRTANSLCHEVSAFCLCPLPCYGFTIKWLSKATAQSTENNVNYDKKKNRNKVNVPLTENASKLCLFKTMLMNTVVTTCYKISELSNY